MAVNVVTHNSDVYIDACLQSVMTHDFPNIVITVIDNASTETAISRQVVSAAMVHCSAKYM